MDLYHLCTENPDHKVWGIYERPKNAKPTQPFKLNTSMFSYNGAKKQAEEFAEKFPDTDFSVQGEKSSNNLPDKYLP